MLLGIARIRNIFFIAGTRKLIVRSCNCSYSRFALNTGCNLRKEGMKEKGNQVSKHQVCKKVGKYERKYVGTPSVPKYKVEWETAASPKM